jgi:hypothetical protein
MENTLLLALVFLAALPAAAQEMTTPNRSASGDAASAWAEDYAAQVDGLLREVHASLHSISARMAAGNLTFEQARELKLAAARDVISRLDALAAIYDARPDSSDKTGARSGSVDGSASDADKPTPATRQANRTISVEELKRETAAAVLTSRPAQVTR